jgi:Skp family chaperone for outer membrane proteins
MKTALNLLLLAGLCTAGAPNLDAQVKIGTIDLRKVFDDYHKTRTADAALKERAAELDKDRKALVEAYQKLREDYDKALTAAADPAISAEERDRRKKAAEEKLLALRAKEQEITQFDREARTALDEQQRLMRDKILGEIRNMINVKAKAGNFTLVLDTSTADPRVPPVVLYSSGENDLTAMVLEALNATAPPGYSPDKKRDNTR